LKFWKYTSAGNDFIVFDEHHNLDAKELTLICDRRFGVGADGVLIFKDSVEFDFEMIYFNSDGGQVEMCGNGARALCHFAKSHKSINKSKLSFRTLNGIYHAEFLGENLIKMKMTEINFPAMNLEDLVFGQIAYIEVGVPHIVILGQEYDESLARKIRYDSRFPNGVNVNFVNQKEKNNYNICTYERGVEGKTLACGTGITAAGAFLAKLETADNCKFNFFSQGGEFCVEYSCPCYYLTGTTQLVFSGNLENKE